jgi:hypothetical protein
LLQERLHCIIAVSCNFVKGPLVKQQLAVYHPCSIEFFLVGEEDKVSSNDDANNGLYFIEMRSDT